MSTRKFFQTFGLVMSAFVFVALDFSVALAGDPPMGGLPWSRTGAWPTANPLSVGQTWAGGFSSSAATPIPVPIAPVIAPTPTLANRAPLIAPVVAPSIVPTVLPTPAPQIPAPSVPGIIGGLSNLLAADDMFRALDPGATAWYRIGVDGEHMDVWLDANPHLNVTLSIFAPGQFQRPMGRGTPDKTDPTRLVWSGGNWREHGDWIAQITNYNPVAVQYKVGTNTQAGGAKSCYSYWEHIGADPVYWTECK